MLKEVLSVSALIAVVLLVRAIFKNRVPKRMIYALWLVVLLKLCLPGTLFSLPVLPAEKLVAPTQISELPAQTTPVIQQPAQTVTQPQTPAQQPVSRYKKPAKPAANPLATAQILQIVWFSGSALLGLWLFSAWLVFTIRLHRDRRFLGKRGGTCIYVSDAVKSPCLAGLIPAVYLTEDVLRNDTTELILRHELTHLRHLDFLWSLCRTMAVIVYWWNPLIWLAAICSKRDAELACDEKPSPQAYSPSSALPTPARYWRRRHGKRQPLESGGASCQGADFVPDEKAAHQRIVCDSGAAARRVCDRLLVCGADAAESGRNHNAGSCSRFQRKRNAARGGFCAAGHGYG